MWTTTHVKLMISLTRMDVDNNTCYVNDITDKDGCGQQHMLMTSLTRMDVDNNTC